LVKAVAWIEENFLAEDCLEGLADVAGASTRHLQRLFRKKLGKTPTQYVTDLRLCHARSLLAETNLSVLEVSLICGYERHTTFSRLFRAKFGMPPSRFSYFGGDKPCLNTNMPQHSQ
jgi:transcriptional regulator GlxA family with amidase domain